MLQCEPEAFFESEQCKLFSSAWLHVSATQVLMIRKHFQRALFTQGGFPSFFVGHWWWAQAVFHFVALSSTIR
jgi:hypothetical protein